MNDILLTFSKICPSVLMTLTSFSNQIDHAFVMQGVQAMLYVRGDYNECCFCFKFLKRFNPSTPCFLFQVFKTLQSVNACVLWMDHKIYVKASKNEFFTARIGFVFSFDKIQSSTNFGGFNFEQPVCHLAI